MLSSRVVKMAKKTAEKQSKSVVGQKIMEEWMASEHPVKRRDAIKRLIEEAGMTKNYASTFFYNVKKQVLKDEE